MERALIRQFQDHIDQALGLWQQFVRPSVPALQAYSHEQLEDADEHLFLLRVVARMIAFKADNP
jgi:hypothetical protein